ncbi:MAG: hypothetical protein EHM41_03370 [Chloroflexi bacterium]|nr:MAG: hypothetical protein EHM41_03370 [Chloroflexota bacterium]
MENVKTETQKTRWWDALAALLLICALITAAARLSVTHWTEDLGLAMTLAVLGAVLGLALGQSIFSPRTSFILAALYGLVLIPWQLGFTVRLKIEFDEKMEALLARVGDTLTLLTSGKPVNDNILFISLMCILFFVLGVHAGYSITRYASAWRAILPAGLVVLVIHTYDPYLTRRALFLAVYLLFSLMLVARLTFIGNRHQWKINHTHMPPDVGFDWIRFTLVVVVVLTFLAWTMPALAQALPSANRVWSFITRPWDILQDRMSNAFSSLESSVGVISDFYGDSLSLGRGSTLSPRPILEVKVPASVENLGRFYWRAYTYDYYSDGQWRSTISDSIEVEPDEFIVSLPELQARTEVEFTVTPQISIATLYTPQEPKWVSVPSQAIYEEEEDGTHNLIALQALPSVVAYQSYDVRSMVSYASIPELRAAGTDYPEYIQENYLQLPDDITPRTRQLAQELASGRDNPYDIATTVTAYLRNFEFSEVIDQAPSRQETVDWWLFEYQKGFCQYYATAEVVLLRSLGIPARVAVGYAQGTFQPGSELEGLGDRDRFINREGTYTVRQQDSHAWPEVYFPGYGWIEFEPTASQDPILRPAGPIDRNPLLSGNPPPLIDTEIELPELPATSETSSMDDTPLSVVVIALYTAAALLVGLIIYLLFVNRTKVQKSLNRIPIKVDRGLSRVGLKSPAFLKRWAYYASLSPVTRSYMEINRALRRMGQPPSSRLTPAERAFSLQQLIPASSSHVQVLISEYHHAAYSLISADNERARQAGSAIRNLSYRAMFQHWIKSFKEQWRA